MRCAWLPSAGITRIRFKGSSCEFSVLFAHPQPIRSYNIATLFLSKMLAACRPAEIVVNLFLNFEVYAFAHCVTASDDNAAHARHGGRSCREGGAKNEGG